jgi:golgi phosphoprotein 3
MNLADELRLCSIDAEGYASSPKVVPALAGALVAELALAGRIRSDDGAVVITDSAPTGDELVDELLGGLVEAGGHTLDPPGWLVRVGVETSPRVHDRLVAAGLITIEPGGRSWLIVVRKPDRMRLTPTGEEPRRRLREVLLGEREADPRTAVLAGLVSACGLVKLQVPKYSRRAAEARAAAFAEGEAVPGAVSEAIAAAQRATASTTLGAQGSIQ